MVGRNDNCWCGSGKKWKKCHFPATAPSLNISDLYLKKYGIYIKTPKQIEGIRRACHFTAEVLDKTCLLAKAGVTTLQLNDYAHQLTIEKGAIPAPLNYGDPPYPKSICTSLNDVVCHGIPDNTPLKEGDIVNIDVSCIVDGYFGDCSRTVCIGKVSPEKKQLVQVTYHALMKSIELLKPEIPLSLIGKTIETFANENHCTVVREFIGHGVGLQFHENPQVLHYKNSNNTPLVPGMTFTIEPMINAGLPGTVLDPIDEWTVRTVDGKPSAQFEHTVLITPTGYEILTPWTIDV